jgi:hypothetical protein
MAAVLTSDLIVLPNDKLDAKQKLALTPKLLCFFFNSFIFPLMREQSQ